MRGPFPTPEVRERLITGALSSAVGETEATAIRLYYSAECNSIIITAHKEREQDSERAEFVVDALILEFASKHVEKWNEIEEHLRQLVNEFFDVE